jgi:hypothetical protein
VQPFKMALAAIQASAGDTPKAPYELHNSIFCNSISDQAVYLSIGNLKVFQDTLPFKKKLIE